MTKREVDAGCWDYTVFLVDDAVVFRFPRREIVVQGTAREVSLLPLLRLPVAIPRPVYIGQPGDDFPWPFYGAPYLPGEEPIGLVDEVRRRLARPLARFLRRCTRPSSWSSRLTRSDVPICLSVYRERGRHSQQSPICGSRRHSSMSCLPTRKRGRRPNRARSSTATSTSASSCGSRVI